MSDPIQAFALELAQAMFADEAPERPELDELFLKHGLIQEVTREGPCTDDPRECSCYELHGEFPTTCYTLSDLLRRERPQLTVPEAHHVLLRLTPVPRGQEFGTVGATRESVVGKLRAIIGGTQ